MKILRKIINTKDTVIVAVLTKSLALIFQKFQHRKISSPFPFIDTGIKRNVEKLEDETKAELLLKKDMLKNVATSWKNDQKTNLMSCCTVAKVQKGAIDLTAYLQ
jgi:hypothetical protein